MRLNQLFHVLGVDQYGAAFEGDQLGVTGGRTWDGRGLIDETLDRSSHHFTDGTIFHRRQRTQPIHQRIGKQYLYLLHGSI